MRRFILCGLFALLTCTLSAQENFHRDSLLARLATLDRSDTLKLFVLSQLTTVTQDNIKEAGHFNDQLLAEAEKQNNDRYKCEAYFMRILLAYNSYNAEAVQSNFKILAPIARATKNYEMLFRGWRCSIDYMLLSQDYEQTEKEAKGMLREAQKLNNITGQLEAAQCLSNIYRMTYRKIKAIEILEQALPTALKYKKNAATTNIWHALLVLYQYERDYKSWLPALQGFEKHLKELSGSSALGENSVLLTVYSSYVRYYLLNNDLKQAAHYLKQAEQVYSESFSLMHRIIYKQACAIYYVKSGENTKAFEKIEQALVETEGSDRYQLLILKADLLHKTGRNEEALPIYKQVQQFNDSVEVMTINKQYELIKKDFNTDQLLLQQARLKHRQQLYTLALLAIGLFIVIYFLAYLLRSHRFLQKAELEMRDMAQQMQQANEIKDRFLSNISNMIHQPLNTVVQGSLRLAAGEVESSEERQELSSRIRSRSAHLLNTINNILDLSRLEAGMMRFEMSDIELTTQLLDAIGSSEGAKHGIEIKHTLSDRETQWMTHADGNRLMQVLTSLFENTAQDCPRITLSIHPEGEKIRLRIEGTILAQKNPSQEVVIRNEINRMCISSFNGVYEIHFEENPPYIDLSLPVIKTTQINT